MNCNCGNQITSTLSLFFNYAECQNCYEARIIKENDELIKEEKELKEKSLAELEIDNILNSFHDLIRDEEG